VWTASISADTADRLEERLAQMHASQNYGGNLQLGPPTPAAPYGRIFIGNGESGREGLVDTELLNFLDKQRVQPLTQIDTSWLAVAHVDEILSFVPRRRGGGTHAIWLNSPKLALDILRAALARYVNGLPELNDYVNRPSGILKREHTDGTSPVTALFRGKLWHHSQQPGSVEIQEPPQFYMAMAEHFQRMMISIHNTPWVPGPGSDRDYPAKMSVLELLFFEGMFRLPDPSAEEGAPTLSTNELIEQEKLGYLRAQVEDACPGTGVVLVPTVYDIVRQTNGSTGAYTPNAANLVIADSRLLIPKPFGPRVKPVDAVAIITEALTENGQESLLNGFNERWLRNARNGLLGVKQWFRPDDMSAFGSNSHLSRLASEFKDGFPGQSESARQRVILNANRSHFRNDNLRDGWHEITIPEDTVDLFEVAIALAAKSLGVEWRFVDSWSYHITSGEIHCGTNALRTPSFAGVTPWWEFYFRAPPT
jgi:Protein-arginine deiminase (PAD)